MSLKLGVVGTCALSGSLDTVGTLNGEAHLVLAAVVGEYNRVGGLCTIVLRRYGQYRREQQDDGNNGTGEMICSHRNLLFLLKGKHDLTIVIRFERLAVGTGK